MIDDLDNVDFILSNVISSCQEALLKVFEDNEVVIKMIRSPAMRHVSRTHRVALDWLCAIFRVRHRHKMTAAKVMDVIARLPGCARQAADAVSIYTHVKMEKASTSLKLTESECRDIWIRLPRHNWPKSWSNIEEPVVLLERNLNGGNTIRKSYSGKLMGNSTEMGMLVCAF